MQVNKNKLRGRIVEVYGTQGKFAEALGCQSATVARKLNDRQNMTRSDIENWSRLLEIPAEEIPAYFFADQVAISQ